jgi:hypothetical protein
MGLYIVEKLKKISSYLPKKSEPPVIGSNPKPNRKVAAAVRRSYNYAVCRVGPPYWRCLRAVRPPPRSCQPRAPCPIKTGRCSGQCLFEQRRWLHHAEGHVGGAATGDPRGTGPEVRGRPETAADSSAASRLTNRALLGVGCGGSTSGFPTILQAPVSKTLRRQAVSILRKAGDGRLPLCHHESQGPARTGGCSPASSTPETRFVGRAP